MVVRRSTGTATVGPAASVEADVQMALHWLKTYGGKGGLANMARYGIPSERAFGVAVRDIQILAKKLGRKQDLAAALWRTGWYEARMLAAYVGEPTRLTPAQMDAWCRDFDNWAICDTVCFVLFDKTSLAWSRVHRWATRREEYVKRAAFALLWGLSVHDKAAADDRFLEGLRLVERAATDERPYVEKAVSMALRAIGKRNGVLNEAAVATAQRLSAASDSCASRIGRGALKELQSASVSRRLTAPTRRQ